IVELHLADGDTPTIRLEQDGSSGWTAQTWDVAGNETNFFIRDVNNGSKLPFRIRPGAPDNSLYIDTDGDVGIGTNAPSAKLDVRGSAMINGDLFAKDGATVGSSYYGSSNIPDNGLIVDGNSGFGTDDIESWDPNWGAIELGGTSSIMYNRGNGSYHASNNAYFNGVWRYKQTGAPAANYHQHNGEHIWRTAPSGTEDAAINWTEGMRVDENGRVGIQNNNPSALLQVGTGGAVCNGTTWIDGSSRDFKKQIQDLSEADLEELMKVLDDVDMVSYLYKQESDDTPRHVGMIAEEMPDILASKDRKGLELGRHVGFLMGVVKVLKTQNEEMAQELEQLKAEIAAIKENK
ncbi:MAG: tail fiber domain-containing protein, partial [Candidatus Omnitrophica bacterium]|nr:tail fiber domain-containing protein [Candidatus Omnitrophota bacterium]